MPMFEMLDARIASALNKIIHNSHFKRIISLEEQKAQKEDRFPLRKRELPTRSTNTSGSLEPMMLSRIMPTYSLLVFEMTRQEFDSKWDGIFVINGENPTWWYLGRIVQIKNTGVWETQDRIGIVCPGDSSEEVRTWLSQIKTMVKRSFEQEIRNNNFGARNVNSERNAVVKNQGTKQRVQRILGDLLAMGVQRAVFQWRQL